MKALPQALLAALVVTPLAFAQQTPAPAPQKVEKIEVTGSNIKRIDAETAAPIQIITAEEIRRSGQTTITQLLRELPSNAAGGLTELTGSGSFSTGAASASLRGLGSGATLVLLNGRRIAPFGLADPNFGQSGGIVNLNAIPLDAIERIEILKDGASAIYGTEAIAGVINIILRKDYKGASVGVTGSANYEGLYKTQSVSGSFGVGDLAKDRYNAFVNLEAFRNESVMFREVEDFLNRAEFRNVYLTGVASSAYHPGLTYISNATGATVPSVGAGCPASDNVNALPLLGVAGRMCLYDQWRFVELVPKTHRESIFARGTFDMTNQTSLYGEASYVQNNVYFKGAPQAVGQGTGATFNPSTGRLNPAPTQLAIGHPNNPFNRLTSVRARMDGVGTQDNEADSKTTRIVAGVKTLLGAFDVDAAYMFNRSETDVTNYNSLRYDRLVAAFGFTVGANAVGNPILIANPAGGAGGYNWSNPNGGGVTADSIRYDARDKAKSQYQVIDVKASGEFGSLPGGAIGIAMGAEYRKEERDIVSDAQKLAGNIFGRGVSNASGERNVRTLFAEAILPVVKGVEFQVAARYDRYSDYGSSITPKVSGTWSPTSNFKFRGSFARGFRAPSLSEITRSATSGFFNGVDDPRRCNRAAGITVGCGLSIPGIIVANPLVQPEKAESWTGGMVWDISKDTDLSVDYFTISRRNEIAFLSLTEILLNEGSSDPRYANRIVRDPANVSAQVPNDPGAILFVNSAFANLGETKVKGIDFDMRHRMSLGEHGKLTLSGNFTFYTDQRGSGAPGAPLVSYNGFRNAPDWRGRILGTWETGNWVNTGVLNYLGSFKSHGAPENQTPGSAAVIADCANKANTYLGWCTVEAYWTIDVGTEYRGFKNWRLGATVRNLTKERPSPDPLARPFNFVWYQPQGTNFILNARYTFR
ncbi:MAG: TonB-dependent receptor [Betaproteobacteria bacterium]|nr:TonB-dependent receptor [Betaproteobacteria bacterium]